MPTFISLINWTDQGIKNAKSTVERSNQAGDFMATLGVRIKSIYWTTGQYDIVTVVEADDEEGSHRRAARARGPGQHPLEHHARA